MEKEGLLLWDLTQQIAERGELRFNGLIQLRDLLFDLLFIVSILVELRPFLFLKTTSEKAVRKKLKERERTNH